MTVLQADTNNSCCRSAIILISLERRYDTAVDDLNAVHSQLQGASHSTKSNNSGNFVPKTFQSYDVATRFVSQIRCIFCHHVANLFDEKSFAHTSHSSHQFIAQFIAKRDASCTDFHQGAAAISKINDHLLSGSAYAGKLAANSCI